jgi:multiple sugar transport system permease protein
VGATEGEPPVGGAPGGRAATRHEGDQALVGEKGVALWFVAPATLMLVLILGFPAIASVLGSVNLGWGSSGSPGIGSYIRLLSDGEFRGSLLNTAIFVVSVVALHFALGMSVALLLNMDVPLRWLFRVVAILPWTMPDVIGGLIFRFIFDTLYGGVNAVGLAIGWIREPVDWLGQPRLAMASVIAAEAWRGYPYVMLILLAGLQSIPREQYEAAAIDGASRWRTFLHVTLPNLKTMIIIALVLDSVWECRLFGMIFGMTGGGPGHATQNLTLLVYRHYFQFFDTAYASSVAVVLAAILLAAALPYLRITMRRAEQ